VIMSHEIGAVEVIIVPHLIPEIIKFVMMVSHAGRVGLERNESSQERLKVGESLCFWRWRSNQIVNRGADKALLINILEQKCRQKSVFSHA